MARIKIKDLPKDLKVSKEELKKIHGGAFLSASLTYGIPVISGSYTAAGCQPVSNDPLAGINKSVLYYSDRNLKKNITEISDEELLEKLDGLPIYNWSYKWDDTVHMGAMAQDLKERFGVGDGKSIHGIDAFNLTLAVQKSLNKKLNAMRGA